MAEVDANAGRKRELLVGLIFVALISALVFFSGLGNYPLFNPDEALYAEPAREMLVTGEYITTLLNYVVRFTKPPLCIWAMALCYQIFGVTEFAARFFGAACAVILVSVTYLSIARFVSIRAALVGSLTLASAPLFVFTAREAITDMPLSLFGAGAQLAFFHANRSAYKRSLLYLGYFLIGLAVMTKGPVGIVLPVAILAVWHFLKGDLFAALKAYRPISGAFIVAAIALPWFITEIVITKGAYFQEFIVRENFQRFTAVVDAHKQPVYYHAVAMLGGFFPWTLYLPQAIFTSLVGYLAVLIGLLVSKSSSTTSSSNSSNSSTASSSNLFIRLRNGSRDYIDSLDDAGQLSLYAIFWAAITLIFFSASVSKLLPYTLPAFPALAIIVACEFERALNRNSFKRLGLPLVFFVVSYAAISLVAPDLISRLRDAPEGLPALISAYAGGQAVIVVVSLIIMRLGRKVAALTFLTAGTALFLMVHMHHVLPILSNKWEGPIPKFSRFAGQSKDPLIVFDMRKPGVPFYALKQVENITGMEDLDARLKQVPQAYILLRVKKLPVFSERKDVRIIAQEGDFALLQFKSN